MRPINLEFGAFFMVVIPCLPGSGVVAILTLRTKQLFMGIVFLVAFHTGRRGVVERSCLMAFLAFHLYMDAGQNEPSLAVIIGRILPFGFLMTGFAFRTQLVLMHIVLAVARNTGCIQLLPVKRLLGNVAFLARRFLVFIPQRVTRIPFVVKDY